MIYKILAATLFVLTSSTGDGCSDPIAGVSIISVSGSSGYSVYCSATNGTSSFLERPHQFRRSNQKHLSLLSDTSGSTQNVCFTASSGATAGVGFVEFGFDSQYVIRSLDFEAVVPAVSFYEPSSFTLDAQEVGGGVSWYSSLSDADNGIPWTQLPFGSATQLSMDFAASDLRLFPNTSTGSLSGNAFSVQFSGCPVAVTAMISFRFEASITSITTRFGLMSTFINSLTEHVCLMTHLVSTPQLCAQIIFSSIQETTVPSNSENGLIRPANVPNVEVYFRVLPPNLATCSDCRDAATIQANLATDLASPSSAGAQLLQAVDSWIADADPFLCYAKTCPTGTLCVSGVCVSATDMAQSQAAAVPPANIPFISEDALDSILNLSPMNVVDGVDQTAGQLVFSSVPLAAGLVQGTGVAATPTTTSSDDFLTRFFIPIIVLSSIGGLILIFVGFKVWQRSKLTNVGRSITA